MIELIRYEGTWKEEWDAFVDESKNGTFLFRRGYMDYHADRFTDHSLLFKSKSAIIAVLPASSSGYTYTSHAGLTYGGLVMSRTITAAEVLEIFKLTLSYLHSQEFTKFIYKPVPHIYHQLPSEEDLYALFRNNATMTARGLSASILQTERLKFRNIRRYGIRKAKKNDVYIEQSNDFEAFWEILATNLRIRHGLNPVHSVAEIKLLATRFPNEIRLYTAKAGDEILAGVVMYKMQTTAHSQYIAASPRGRELGALDLLFDRLINDVFADLRYFDFGISTENDGTYLNESLEYQKEGFGGRSICYDRYEIKLSPNDPTHGGEPI